MTTYDPWNLAPAPLLPPPPPAPPRRRRPWRVVLPATTVALSLAAGWAGGQLAGSGDSTPAATVTATPASVVVADGAIDVAEVLAAVEPSVVSIDTTVQVRQGPYVSEGQGAGTGVVIDDLGHILTNAHVVADATTITVTVDGVAREARLVGADTAADIAVLQVDDARASFAADLATSTTAVGDDVVAIGNALALEGGLTVTEGIVSALDRSIETELRHARRADPDRRRHQLRQLRRRAGQRGRRGDRHQHRRGPQQRQRLGVQHRLRHLDPRCPRGGRPAHGHRVTRQRPSTLLGCAHAARAGRHRRTPVPRS